MFMRVRIGYSRINNQWPEKYRSLAQALYCFAPVQRTGSRTNEDESPKQWDRTGKLILRYCLRIKPLYV